MALGVSTPPTLPGRLNQVGPTPTPGVGASVVPGAGQIAQPMAQGPAGPRGPSPAPAPRPAPASPTITPQGAYGVATAASGPQQQYIAATVQGIGAGQALNGQQLQDQVNYAQSQYGTGIQNLSLDQQNINAQQAGLGGDRTYLNAILGNTRGQDAADRGFATHDSRIAQDLYTSLMGQNHVQAGLYNNQLAQQLAQIGYQMNQSRGTAANDTQQLGEQVGAQGAFGSRGAGTRGAFIQSTLANALGGFTQQQGLARTQHGLSESQLSEQRAQNLSTRDNQMNVNQRRISNANYNDSRAAADYNHGMSQNSVSDNQLRIAAARLGVSASALRATLNNAVNSANLGYGSGALQANQALAQQAYAAGTMNQNIGSNAYSILHAANTPQG